MHAPDDFLTPNSPTWCPGCGNFAMWRALRTAYSELELPFDKLAVVWGIGCHGNGADFTRCQGFHALHGRALPVATGLHLSNPELTVVVEMGDGDAFGIGLGHFAHSCRRNLDITLLILNNFNYGMTGGQCSATTPATGKTASGFLSELEPPLDICRVAAAAGAPYIGRTMATGRELVDQLAAAIRYPGFALMDIWGLCPGRYTKRNRLTLTQMAEDIESHGQVAGPVAENEREEYAAHYLRLASGAPSASEPLSVATTCEAPTGKRCDVLLLGSAGQYINTVGEILCLAGMSGGLHVSQKNDYPITVLRGHSIAEVVLDRQPIDYTGIGTPAAVLCVAPEGVARRKKVFALLPADAVVVKDSKLAMPDTRARIIDMDFTSLKIRASEQALAALAMLAREGELLTHEMLIAGLSHRYRGKMLEDAKIVVGRICGR